MKEAFLVWARGMAVVSVLIALTTIFVALMIYAPGVVFGFVLFVVLPIMIGAIMSPAGSDSRGY